MSQPATIAFRYAVNVTPRPGILDPQGRAVEQSLPHLSSRTCRTSAVGRRVELTVTAPTPKRHARSSTGSPPSCSATR